MSPFDILKDLNKSQYWSRTELETLQIEKLNELIESAKSETVYYRRLLNCHINKFQDLSSFSKEFPKLTRELVDINDSQLTNHSLNDKLRHSTSGSSGRPLSVQISGIAESYRLAGKMRFFNWWGVDFHDRSVLIWKMNKNGTTKGDYSKRIKTKLRNRLDLDIFELSDDTIFDYVKMIDDFEPKYIRSYKSGVFQLAQLMEKHQLRFKTKSLKVAIVTSEVLNQEERNLIQKILNCKVANEYGSAEAGFYAGECPHGSMHINEELVFISTDNENHALVTELNNHGTPLINYQNNDRIKISNKYCECGRTSRIIENIEGRVSDYILCSDGSKKSAILISYIVKDAMNSSYAESIKQFRLVQNKNNFLFEFVPGERYDERVLDEIKSRMVKQIGDDIEIETQLRKRIIREKSGKLRYFLREE